MRACAALVIVAAVSCGAAPAAPRIDAFAQLDAGRFRFNYAPGDAEVVQAIAAAANAAAPRVLQDLAPDLAASMPRVTVTYYATQAAMADAVRPIAGNIPPWASGLVTSSSQIHLLSPGVMVPRQSTGDAALNLVHEFAHCVTLAINPSAANNPRWLWEVIAVYEAPQPASSAALAAVLAGPVPRAADFNSFETTTVYTAGHSIGDFIVRQHGPTVLRALLRANGDTQAVLGQTPDQFIAAWFAWANSR